MTVYVTCVSISQWNSGRHNLKEKVTTDIPQHQSRKAYSMSSIVSRLSSPTWSRPPHCWGFEITLGRTLMDEWSIHRGDYYLTRHKTHNI